MPYEVVVAIGDCPHTCYKCVMCLYNLIAKITQ